MPDDKLAEIPPETRGEIMRRGGVLWRDALVLQKLRQRALELSVDVCRNHNPSFTAADKADLVETVADRFMAYLEKDKPE